MLNQMNLTIFRSDDYTKAIGTITRSFDNEQALGNFAVCRVRVNGQRFNRVSCEPDLYVSAPLKQGHPDWYEGQGDLWRACLAVLYKHYRKACRAESCEPHNRHMWAVYGYPTGPIG